MEGSHSQGGETDDYHESRNIHRCLREERERGAGKASWKRILLRFDLRRSWASEEAEMVIHSRESSICKGPVVMCSFMHSLYLFIQQMCIECQPSVCTMHTGYKVNKNGAYMQHSVSLG